MGICGTCGTVLGVVVLVSGLSFAGVVGALTPMIGGWLLALYGLGLLVHGLGMCPTCSSKK